MSVILEVTGLTKHFRGLQAVSSLDFTVTSGEIMGIIGPNGAGKTTVFNLLTGFLIPTSGNIIFKGESIVGKKPHEIVHQGIARTFQVVRPFHQMTVLDNVVLPHLSPKNRKRNKNRRENEKHAARILDQVGLANKMYLLAGVLSHGELRRLEVARALATSPDLILLDEPFSGLALPEIDPLSLLIKGLRETGLNIIIIEHRLRELMKLIERILVINFGLKIADGTPEEIAKDEKVIEAYMGKKVGLADVSY